MEPVTITAVICYHPMCLADDHSRVVLQRDDLDYINASVVKVPTAGRAYILTQVCLTKEVVLISP